MQLQKPHTRNMTFAEFYNSEVATKSDPLRPFIDWLNVAGGGSYITGDLLKNVLATFHDPKTQGWGNVYSVGGDGPEQAYSTQGYLPDYSAGSYVEHDLRNGTLSEVFGTWTHDASGNYRYNEVTSTTTGVSELFHVGGVLDAEQANSWYAGYYGHSLGFGANIAVSAIGANAWNTVLQPQLESLLNALAPGGTVTVTDDVAAYDNWHLHYQADDADAWTKGLPTYIDVYAVVEN